MIRPLSFVLRRRLTAIAGLWDPHMDISSGPGMTLAISALHLPNGDDLHSVQGQHQP
jgi:hypothetical protein